MTPLKAWFFCARPKTLTATFAPLILATALVDYHYYPVARHILLMAFLTTLFLQIASNFVNDVADYKKGADREDRLGPPRAVASGWLSPQSVWRAAILCLFGALLCGLPLMWIGGKPIIILGLLSLLCAYTYTAGPYPLAYHGLGELGVLIFFGFTAVGGLTFLLTQVYPLPGVFRSSFQMGLLATTMISLNNLRDIESDRMSGKKTLAARYGQKFMKSFLAFCFLAPYFMNLFWLKDSLLVSFAPWICLPFALFILKKIYTTAPSQVYNQYLALASLHLLAFTLTLSGALFYVD
jgi:1,4-dihydroxy-2-naphthoate octaprenyltransferase